MAKKIKKMYRSYNNRVLAGVCAGIAEYLDVDPTVIRLLWVVLTILSFGAGVIAYLAAWIIIPER
jgi:phage shock protein C